MRLLTEHEKDFVGYSNVYIPAHDDDQIDHRGKAAYDQCQNYRRSESPAAKDALIQHDRE
jgi:hypothetical protein